MTMIFVHHRCHMIAENGFTLMDPASVAATGIIAIYD
jgi:hypothetical protein